MVCQRVLAPVGTKGVLAPVGTKGELRALTVICDSVPPCHRRLYFLAARGQGMPMRTLKL
jgi:hypothetical protein